MRLYHADRMALYALIRNKNLLLICRRPLTFMGGMILCCVGRPIVEYYNFGRDPGIEITEIEIDK